MPTLDTVSLQQYGICRCKNEPLSVWYAQPVIQLPDDPPFIPKAGPHATGLQILHAILEHQDFRESDCEPAIVILPELSVPYTDIAAARALISNAPKGTLVVFGAAHMTEGEALSLEPMPELWDGGAAGRFANCAVVGLGGFDRVFLQPKLLKSAKEMDCHWPGKVIRCFEGDYIRFSVFICSDLLNRPGNSCYMAWLHNQLELKQHKLTFALWLQHNDKPRSGQFSNALETVANMDRTTIIVVGSRMVPGGKRFENYAVSGALARRTLFPSEFDKFTHRFHYVEQASLEVSRAVLLRYDADAYRVRTVLADALDAADKVEKGELFDSSQPYVFSNGALVASSENRHMHDLCEPARLAARARFPDLSAAIDSVALRLTEMSTPRFLSFLDLGVVPRTPDGERPHVAGKRHDGGDLSCRCWKHRECIDLLTEPEDMEPLAAIMGVLAILEAGGYAPNPRTDLMRRTNVDVTFAGTQKSFVVVYPFSFAYEALAEKLWGEKPPVVKRLFILVADQVDSRPPVGSVNVAQIRPEGAMDPARAELPLMVPLKASELRRAGLAGNSSSYLGSFLAGE